MNEKKSNKTKYTGDGKLLYNAVSASDLRTSEFYEKMGISRGTLYNLYESADLDYSTKSKSAMILNSSVDTIWGQSYIDTGSVIKADRIEENPTNANDSKIISEKKLSSRSTKTISDMNLNTDLFALLREAQTNVTNLISNNTIVVKTNEKLVDGQLELIQIMKQITGRQDESSKKAKAS